MYRGGGEVAVAVSASFRAFVLEQLGRVLPDVRERRMFGGVGLYSGDLFFALIGNDTLYLKADDQTRGDFEAIGMGPFRPYGDDRESMNYYEVAASVLEDVDALQEWATKAVDVARRARTKKRKRS